MVTKKPYCPERGDLIWINCSPQPGREQSGRRPAVVLSPSAYQKKIGLILICPITSHRKGYPFETALPSGLPVSGVILCDQLRSLDWQHRVATKLGDLPSDVLQDVLAKIAALLQIT
jgi:mRNA interferase MazF